MIFLIQIFLSVLVTLVFSLRESFSFDFGGILNLALVFIVANIVVMIIIFIIFVLLIYLTEKYSDKALWKHKVFDLYNHYIFNFIYRVKPIIFGKENLPKDNNFVVVSNHVEYTDPLYIKQVYKDFPLAFVSKAELFEYPLIKTLVKSTGNIPLSRKSGDRQALNTILQAIKKIKDGQPMGIFPEGTRSYSNQVAEFKAGSFKMAQKAQADISTVVLYNMHETRKKFKFFRVKVYIKVLPIIKYEEYSEMSTNDLSDFIREKIVKEITNFDDFLRR